MYDRKVKQADKNFSHIDGKSNLSLKNFDGLKKFSQPIEMI